MWPVIVLPVRLISPESPWWLVRNNKLDKASKALRRLSTKHLKVDIEKTVAIMQKTSMYEERIETGGSVIDCFKGSACRRTEILIIIFVAQDSP